MCRLFYGTVRTHAGVAVVIDGVQYFDGTVERKLFLGREDYSPDVRRSLADARAIAANLLAAADEMESVVTS